jgi:hypothetical protein
MHRHVLIGLAAEADGVVGQGAPGRRRIERLEGRLN